MSLTLHDRERLADCVLFIESAQKLLDRVDPSKLPDLTDIRNCFSRARESLSTVLES